MKNIFGSKPGVFANSRSDAATASSAFGSFPVGDVGSAYTLPRSWKVSKTVCIHSSKGQGGGDISDTDEFQHLAD